MVMLLVFNTSPQRFVLAEAEVNVPLEELDDKPTCVALNTGVDVPESSCASTVIMVEVAPGAAVCGSGNYL